MSDTTTLPVTQADERQKIMERGGSVVYFGDGWRCGSCLKPIDALANTRIASSTPPKDERALPSTAGVCAYDRDECTVTLALDTEEQVKALVNALPAKNRVRLCDATPTSIGEGLPPACPTPSACSFHRECLGEGLERQAVLSLIRNHASDRDEEGNHDHASVYWFLAEEIERGEHLSSPPSEGINL